MMTGLYQLEQNAIMKSISHELTKNDETAIICGMKNPQQR